MAVPAVDVVPAIESLLERKEMLHKAFSELESKKAVLSKLGANWKDVDDYLKEVEERLRYTLEELSAKEEALDAKMKEAKKALDKRDTEVSAREQASLAFVQEQKDAAVAVILELKCKWSEVRKRKQLEASKKKEEEEEEDEEEEEEEDTSEKEENPDTQEGAANSDESPNPKLNITNGSALQAMGANTKPAAGNGGKTDPDHTLSLSDLIAKEASVSASKSVEIKPRSQLKSLCEAMASDKLRLFIAERRKDLNAISAELPFALKAAGDPAQLVLKALEGYYPSDHNVSHGTKKDVSLPANKRACVIMLEALADVLADPVLGAEHPIVSEELKSSAKQIADLWKSKINLEVDLTSNLSIDAQSFLQLLATFGLASEYDQDELCKLVLPIARRKQTPSLCRSLDLSTKLPDVIESLIKDGKQMEAISFAAEFELLDRFQPVPLLKSYLKDVRKVVQNTLKGGNNTMSAQNDANQKELSALKVVLKAINDFKLEEIYAPAPLEKRVAQLEKAKVDRKRSAPSGKPQQMKRPRTHNSGGATGGMVHEKSYYRPSDSRAQYGDAGLPYNAATQSGYDRLPLGGYSSAYGGGTRSPVSLQSSYMYPSDSIGSLGYGSSAYPATPSTAYTATPSAAYSSYGYGTGLPSRYQSYL